jgi:ribonuclease HI
MERHDDNALIIYTDGSSLSKPRRAGGYGYVFVWADECGEEQTEAFNGFGFTGATNNEMELKACIEALKCATGRRSPVPRDAWNKIVIYSDSLYVVDNIWAAETLWPRLGWETRDGEPVRNPDLWKELVKEKRRAGRVEFRHVKGHKSSVHNKRADGLAKESAKIANRALPAAADVRRRTSPRRTEAGSVPMRGQEETIRIVVRKNIPGRRGAHIYKYEVVDPESEHYQAVDEAFAENGKVEMRPHHTYLVRFRSPGQGRWIDEVIEEIGVEAVVESAGDG